MLGQAVTQTVNTHVPFWQLFTVQNPLSIFQSLSLIPGKLVQFNAQTEEEGGPQLKNYINVPLPFSTSRMQTWT